MPENLIHGAALMERDDGAVIGHRERQGDGEEHEPCGQRAGGERVAPASAMANDREAPSDASAAALLAIAKTAAADGERERGRSTQRRCAAAARPATAPAPGRRAPRSKRGNGTR